MEETAKQPQMKTQATGLGLGAALAIMIVSVLEKNGVEMGTEFNMAFSSVLTTVVTWFSQKKWG